jgi:antitoxin component YwqK of YwqJK toxin-antitoxin module
MSEEAMYDDLEYTPIGVYLLNGLPFTGTAYEQDENGKRVCEIPFVAGKEQGLSHAFFSSGRFSQETPYVAGKKHGTEFEWFEDGQVRQERVFEFGVMMTSKEWSREGILVKEYARPCDDHLYKLVEKERKNGEGTA